MIKVRTDIKKYIEKNIPELKGRVTPLFVMDLSAPSVAYAVTDVLGGHLRQSQLEIKIIGTDYEKCDSLSTQMADILDFKIDEPFVIEGTTRFWCTLSGGGILFQDEIQAFEFTQYYTIKWREIK